MTADQIIAGEYGARIAWILLMLGFVGLIEPRSVFLMAIVAAGLIFLSRTFS